MPLKKFVTDKQHSLTHTHTHQHTYTHTSTHIHTHTSTHTHTHTHTDQHTHTSTHMNTHTRNPAQKLQVGMAPTNTHIHCISFHCPEFKGAVAVWLQVQDWGPPQSV